MSRFQAWFPWLHNLTDTDASLAFLGMGMLLSGKFTKRLHRRNALWNGTLSELKGIAGKNALSLDLLRTATSIDRMDRFLPDAQIVAGLAREILSGELTWIACEGYPSRASDGTPAIFQQIDQYFQESHSLFQSAYSGGFPQTSVSFADIYAELFRSLLPNGIPLRLHFPWPRKEPTASYPAIGSPVTFHWPLQIRVRSEEFADQILSELERSQKLWVSRLINLSGGFDNRGDVADVWLIDEPFDDTIMWEMHSTVLPILLLSDPFSKYPPDFVGYASWRQNVPYVLWVRQQGYQNPPPSADLSFATRWLIEFVRQLSHNEPLLWSAFCACGNEHSQSTPILFSSGAPGQSDLRLGDIAKSEIAKLADTERPWIDLDGDTAQRLNISSGLRPMHSVTPAVFSRMESGEFFFKESYGATTLANLFEGMRYKRFSNSDIDRDRWLQAQVLSAGDLLSKETIERAAFQRSKAYLVRVWIGPENPDSIRADVRFPSDKLDWADDVEQLTVVFTEPTFSREPQIRTIDLPRLGHSTTCDFTLDTTLLPGTQMPPAGIRARVAILHGNRVLQTAILSGELTEPITSNEGRLVRLEIEGVVRPDLNDLRERTRFDAAMIVNETLEHEHTMVTISTSPEGVTHATFRPLTGVLDTMKLLSKQLTKIASLEQQPPWDSPEIEQLFRFLATHGYEIYRVLVKEQSIGIAELVENATHLQVVAADEQVYFPIELFYNRPPPLSTAKLCPAAKEALRTNACPLDCPGRGNTDDYVCPRGFLGIQKVIERHVCRSETSSGLVPGSFRMQMEPSSTHGSLPVFKRIVYGASKRVWEYKPPLMPPLEMTMTSLCPGGSVSVANWEELKTKSTGVSLLVLIPHCEIDQLQNYESLEIGTVDEASPMVLSDLRRGHLGLAADEKRPVVVLLMGCETGSPDADYRGFAAKFREHGAAVVVTALSKVLGRQVVPVTQALLKGISEALAEGTPVRLGELLTQQRRKLLAEGYALVIGITAYGDADWVLVATSAPIEEVAHAVG